MSFLLRIVLVAVAGLCLVGTRLVMQRHLNTETARLAPVNAVVGDANLAAIALNRSVAGQQTGRWLPLLTMATDATQAIVGSGSFPGEDTYYNTSGDARRYVSIANVGVGTATLLFGT